MMDDPYVPTAYRVVQRRRETADTVTLQLISPDCPTFAFEPGQFNMISAFGVAEVPISISGSTGRPEILEHTIREVGVATSCLVGLRVGDWVGVRGPFGCGWPMTQAERRDLLVIAGGLGLAPLRSTILHTLGHRERYRRFVVLYGARTPQDVLFRHELEEWRGRFDAEVRLIVDRADATWRGNVGVVTTLFDEVQGMIDPANSVAMICGPDVMMRFCVRELQKRGTPDERIYLSLERNMKCAIGFCGHCQYGPFFLCKDGPVFAYSRLRFLSDVREF